VAGEPARPKRVLLAVFLDSHFHELIRVARLLRDSGRYRPVVVFARDYPARPRDVDACRRESIDGVDARGEPIKEDAGPAPAAPVPPRRRLRASVRRLSPRLESALHGLAVHLVEENLATALPLRLTQARRSLREARALVARLRPDLLVLAEDTVEYGTAALVRAAREQGAPTVIVPFTVATAEEPAETYAGARRFQVRGMGNRLLARLSPRWVHEHRGRRLVRQPAPRAFALELTRLAPPRPWTVHGGRADRVAVESDHMLALYRAEGVPEEKLAPTGALYDDVLAAARADAPARKAALAAELGLDPTRPLVLSALPPDQLGSRTDVSEFRTYAELVAAWVGALAAPHWNVVLTAHPRARPADVAVPPHPRVWLVARDTAELVPLADLFVASASATIRWAIACGVPVVNYDVYRYAYADYRGLAGVMAVSDRESFARVLGSLASDTAALRRAAEQQRAEAPRWGRLDGRSGARLLALFDSMAEPTGGSR
jgi:hypothetical protein